SNLPLKKFTLVEYMREDIPDIDEYIKSKQLMLIPACKWYLHDNSFNELRVNKKWLNLIRKSQEYGYDGLRAVADTSWLEKCYFRSFSEYEKNINALISELPFIVVCLYDGTKLNLLEFAEVIKNHTHNIIKENNEFKILKNVELLVKNKQLFQSEENYRNLLRFLPVGIFIHDIENILYCNEASAHLLGYNSVDKIIGKSLLDYIAPDNRRKFQEFITKILNNSTKVNFFKGKFELGTRIIDGDAVSSRFIYKGFPAVLSVVKDITPLTQIVELKKDIERTNELLNETLEYDKIKTEFFSNLSH
ncbi:MAG: PAS domain S-box protein, partial [Clostridiaceae bacterium]|nr:PAS domain S-box protein [Clostridiaceae bacterium]